MSGEHETPVPEWIRQSIGDEPLEKRRQLERIWSLLEESGEREPHVPHTDAAWVELVDRMAARDERMRRANDEPVRSGEREPAYRAGDEPARRARNRRTGRIRPWRGVAAVAATMAIVFIAGTWWMFRPVTIATPAGAQQTVHLPDGSTAEMNSETSIRFARRSVPIPMGAFASRRVALEGEAYFRVVSSSRPFIVETADAEVEALGTEFNVHARRGAAENGTIVTLARGSVRLAPRSGTEHPVTLSEAGGSARVSRTAEIICLEPAHAAPLDHVLAWRRSGFAVVNRPLEAVLNEVERRYAIEITPRGGLDLTDSMSAFYLRGAAPEQILRDVCLVQACTYRETSRGFALAALAARDTTNGSPTNGSPLIPPDRMSPPE
jgi:ferric-dicitrate binding protein FerR (iron transport regulator)